MGSTSADEGLSWIMSTHDRAVAGCCRSLSRLREHEEGQPWIKTFGAELLFGVLIVANALVMGVSIELSLREGDEAGDATFYVELVFLVAFIIELALRIAADGCGFFSLHNYAGLFDLVIITGSILEAILVLSGAGSGALTAVGSMRVFRLLRIGRVARILHVCKPLWLLLTSLIAALQAVCSVFCLVFVLLYICSLVLCLELGHLPDKELKHYFGSVGSSLYTHFMIVTLEGYPAVAKAVGRESWLWYVYIVIVIVCFNVVLLNLVTGIVLEHVTRMGEDDEDRIFSTEAAKFCEVLYHLLDLANISPAVAKTCACGAKFPDKRAVLCEECGDERREGIDYEKWRDEIIPNQSIREVLHIMDICLIVEDWQLWQAIDKDGLGTLSLEQFAKSLLRLRGTKHMLHSLLVQGDLLQGMRRERQRLTELEQHLGVIGQEELDRFEMAQNRRFVQLHKEVADLPSRQQEQVEVARRELAVETSQEPDRVRFLMHDVDTSSKEAGQALGMLKQSLLSSRERLATLQEKIQPLKKEALGQAGVTSRKGVLRLGSLLGKDVSAGQMQDGEHLKGLFVQASVGDQEQRTGVTKGIWSPSWADELVLPFDLTDIDSSLLDMQVYGIYGENASAPHSLGWCSTDLSSIPKGQRLLVTQHLCGKAKSGAQDIFTGAELEFEVEMCPGATMLEAESVPRLQQATPVKDHVPRTPICCLLQADPSSAAVIKEPQAQAAPKAPKLKRYATKLEALSAPGPSG